MKIMTFYDMMPEVQHGWTNVYRGNLESWKNKTITETWKMKILVGLGGNIFARARHSLFPDWQAEVDKFSAEMKPQLDSGKTIGVFLGDEICCGGTPYKDMVRVANRLRSKLGPRAWLYTNECSEMQSWPKLKEDGSGGVPAALDAISVDFYDEKNTNGAAEVKKNKEFYHEQIFPRLHPHQQVLFVPGIFASSPDGCMRKGVHCPLDSQAKQIVIKLDGFWQWAKSEPRVAGFNPWHFRNRSSCQWHLPYDQRLGAVSMPSVVAKLKEMGQQIGEWQLAPVAAGMNATDIIV